MLLGLTELPGFDALRDPPLQPASIARPTRSTATCSSSSTSATSCCTTRTSAYDPVVALSTQAADDPDVLAIKQTLYRASSGSPIIAACSARPSASKQVTVLVELTARFDEERNIRWARALEAGGRARDLRRPRLQDAREDLPDRPARRRTALRRYVHLGTGNYNERTARLYTDFGLMTAAPRDLRGRVRVLQRAHRLLGSAAPQEAGDGADRSAPRAS